jgi:hypothetical protein
MNIRGYDSWKTEAPEITVDFECSRCGEWVEPDGVYGRQTWCAECLEFAVSDLVAEAEEQGCEVHRLGPIVLISEPGNQVILSVALQIADDWGHSFRVYSWRDCELISEDAVTEIENVISTLSQFG